MIRDLQESYLPTDEGYFMFTPLRGAHASMYFNLLQFLGIFCSHFLHRLIWPANSFYRRMVPCMYIGTSEMFDYSASCGLALFLITFHMVLPGNYLLGTVSFYHLGAIVGPVFYAVLAKCIKPKPAVVVCLVFGAAVYAALIPLASQLVKIRWSYKEKDYLVYGYGGNRKMRPILNPLLVKDLSGGVGFDGAYSLDFQRLTLCYVFAGFAFSSTGVSQTILLHWCPNEPKARKMLYIFGLGMYTLAPYGAMFCAFWIDLFDIDGCYVVYCLYRAFRAVYCALFVSNPALEDMQWASEETYCYVKALYYALFLYPQGPGGEHNANTVIYAVWDRFHWLSPMAGYVIQARPWKLKAQTILQGELMLMLLHMPTVGGMFLAIFLAANPQYCGMGMEMVSVYKTAEGFENYYMWIFMFPAFVGSHVKASDTAFQLSVMESLKHLGEFMAIARWPNQLFCGDPMACWRSQYLYSHAIFHNVNGDGGNIQYVNWYLFSKSQKRQCCCPYRKLKPDAPEKSCPPCCLGPLVEETGGCPCPCCCASCSA
jgi:hypothetical protein